MSLSRRFSNPVRFLMVIRLGDRPAVPTSRRRMRSTWSDGPTLLQAETLWARLFYLEIRKRNHRLRIRKRRRSSRYHGSLVDAVADRLRSGHRIRTGIRAAFGRPPTANRVFVNPRMRENPRTGRRHAGTRKMTAASIDRCSARREQFILDGISETAGHTFETAKVRGKWWNTRDLSL